MKLHLRDHDEEVVAAWQEVFKDEQNVSISCGDIFSEGEHLRSDSVVSPANSFGYMDGGIDYVYSEFFGPKLQEELQSELYYYHGELPVGMAVIVFVHRFKPDCPVKSVISAPTMRVPMDIRGTVNVFLAFRAALRIADFKGLNSVLCPGLGTGIGKVPAELCAKQMYEAWKRYDKSWAFPSLGDAFKDHHALLSYNYYDDFTVDALSTE
jgi:O-acetyl-ADP-ribose deacetylase (regulator of RNase III)